MEAKGLLESVMSRFGDENSIQKCLSGGAFDLQETDDSGVNAFWICSVVFAKTSLKDITALLHVARGYQTSEGEHLLLFCALESGGEAGKERLVTAQPTASDYVNVNYLDARADLRNARSEAEGMLYTKQELTQPAWRWVVRSRKAQQIIDNLGQEKITIKIQDTDTWVLLCASQEEDKSIIHCMGVDVVDRYVIRLAEMAPYARRQAFSGLWMACRAGNFELLDFLLTPGTPWAVVVKRAFGYRVTDECEVGEVVWGEVWREMDLPQRIQSCGQAALMSGNLDLINLLQNRLGAETFWRNCRFMDNDIDNLFNCVEEVTNAFMKHGLLRLKRVETLKEKTSRYVAENWKEEEEGESDLKKIPMELGERILQLKDFAAFKENSKKNKKERTELQRQLYEWSMTQALSISAFVRESERPLTGSITTFVRLARGDIECAQEDLHGPNLFQRTAQVLALIHEQMDFDSTFIPKLSLITDVDELLTTLLLYFILPFYWSIQSGNLPAFRFVCDRIYAVVDGLLEVNRQKLNFEGGEGGKVIPSASSLLIGLLTQVPVEVQDRKALWQAVVAQFRFKAPEWYGADLNGFPRDFELLSWCEEVIFDGLLQSIWWLHLATFLSFPEGRKQQQDWFWIPGGVANFIQAKTLGHINFEGSKEDAATVFWMKQLEAFCLRLENMHGMHGIKVLKKGETPEVDWQQFLSRHY